MQLKKLTPVQLLILIYFSASILSSFLLWLPISHQPGVELSYLDSLFTAVSAISVTGLTVANTADTFSPTGIILIMAMIQFGGVGFMTVGTFLWMATGQRIGIQRRRMIMLDQNRSDLAGLVRLMRDILIISLAIEALGAVLMGIYLHLVYGYGWNAIAYGAFSSLSAYTNAGLDIFGDSLMGFRNDGFFLALNMGLIVAGGIGFPVLIELKEWFASRSRRNFHFSLFTKITVTTYIGLLLLGMVGLWLLEGQHLYAGQGWGQAFWNSLFFSVTMRSCGLTILDLNDFTVSSQLFLSLLMFIGASPSSVGGGIRTTTLAVVILAIIGYARGQHHIRIFHRELMDKDIRKAAIIFSIGILLVGLATIAVTALQPQQSLNSIIFEVNSAFGTTGASLGISAELSPLTKGILMVLMFVGRIGILPILFLFRGKTPPDPYRYPREHLIIGH
ncbi:Trk-type K+ transport system membrane component [Kroppenstedtia sanguinis]|uniref:TrkH family potassium uptake protein n=1 Tax=Kroppenstedtia sanguinis TaxID=1380684 RepID=UPI003D2199FA